MMCWVMFKWKIAIILIVQYLSLSECEPEVCTKENQLYHDANDPDKVCVLGCKSGESGKKEIHL